MIKSIRIINFQSHKDSYFEFDPNLNVIIGDTDSGKSAIIRALEWVIWNVPRGDEFRSDWGGDTKVILTLWDGNIIERGKTDKENYYKLNKHEFKAIKTGVPIEIQNVLNIKPINFQSQIDNHFLLKDSAGKVATFFNEVAKLDKIDYSTQQIKSEIRNINSTIKSKEKDLETKKEELKKYNNLEEQLSLLEEIEKNIVTKEGLEKELSLLILTLKQIENINSELDQLTSLLKLESLVNSTLDAIKEKENKQKELNKLSKILNTIKQNEQEILNLNKITQFQKQIKEIDSDIAIRNNLNKEYDTLSTVLMKEHLLKKEIAKNEGQIVKLEKQFKKEMPDVCPLCETELK